MVKGKRLIGCKISREVAFEVRITGDITPDDISKMIDMLTAQQFILLARKAAPQYILEQFLEDQKIRSAIDIDIDSLPDTGTLKGAESLAMDEIWQSMVMTAKRLANENTRQMRTASIHMVLYINEKLKQLQRRNGELLKKAFDK